MDTATLLDPDQWAEQTFGAAHLRDRRRTRRAVKAAGAIVRDPAASLPQQQQTWKAVKALYRLLNASDVTFEALLHPHWEQTRAALNGHAVVLLLQDTTELDCSSHVAMTGKQFGNGATLDNGSLVLSKIGRIAVRWSRPLEGAPKTVTLSREADGWYVYFSCADVPVRPLPATGRETGIDLGLDAFATLSNGERIFHPGWYRQAERRLKTTQRRVSRRKKGSNRRRKAATLLARAHLKVKRQRADFHHKTALALVGNNDTIYHEDLQTANLVKNHHLAKSISDAGWSGFLSILSHKAAWAGRRVVAVPPAYTSQTCSGCGVMVHKGLSVRWHACPDCGTSQHRDHNAARNIERAGLALRGAVA